MRDAAAFPKQDTDTAQPIAGFGRQFAPFRDEALHVCPPEARGSAIFVLCA